ncbi:MAG: hypothetical protein JSS32_06150 [Verrucomicrobia bacterium]|nr:hypothetical protein [Verrucomicrobiota bacterium]
MSYDTGVFTLFNQQKNFTSVFADLRAPQFNPSNTLFGSVYGSLVAPSVTTTGTGTIGTLYGQQVAPTLSPTGGTVSTAYTLYLTGPSLSAGNLTSAFGLYVAPPSGSGTILNNYTASILGVTGFGTTTPKNILDVQGGVAIGSFAGSFAAPTNGLIVTGKIGVANASPVNAVDVTGTINSTRVFSGGLTNNNQLVGVVQGTDQGNFGGGSVGTQKTMSANTTTFYPISNNISSQLGSMEGGPFDGRFLYIYANFDAAGATYSGTIGRYDTTLPINASTSYAIFNAASSINSTARGFNSAGIFDGRYVYNVATFGELQAKVLRYDTTGSFTSVSSYAFFNLSPLNANVSPTSRGAVFDGRFVYYVPRTGIGGTYILIAYDTTKSFSLTTSYSVFDVQTVNLYTQGSGATFDGRYLYLPPAVQNIFVQYDTSLPFTQAGSYASFDVSTIGSFPLGDTYYSVFDGRYVYLLTGGGGTTYILNYDTTLPFSLTTSYNIFNLQNFINTTPQQFVGGVFDGRYVYFTPASKLYATVRYDTTKAFGASTSYSFFNTYTVNSNTGAFSSASFDGRYIYSWGTDISALPTGVVRFDAYPGPLATAITAAQSANGFAMGTFAGTAPPAGGLIVSGNVGVGVSSPSATLDLTGATLNATRILSNGSTFNNQLIGLATGNNQGGFGSGFVGAQKTMSANTTLFFNTQFVLTTSINFWGSVFDGRYVYFVPNQNPSVQTGAGLLLRYDTTVNFSASSSYAVFDMTTVQSNSVGFSGGAFDGKYVYLVPFATAVSYTGQITRYDTTSSFTSAANYSVFDLRNLNASACGFNGAIFDGRYVYFIPYFDGNTYSGLVARYDSTLAFSSTGSYSFFNLGTNINSNSVGFYGGSYDGRYIYFSPFINNSTLSGQLTRFDTSLPFSTATSYSTFNLAANLNSNSLGFRGSVFDGRYVYLIQYQNALSFAGQVTRYDTTLSFGTAGSYSYFDTRLYVNSTSLGFQGGSFDGRYLYFVPNVNTVTLSGQVTRYDTTLPFGSSVGYTYFNTQPLQSVSCGFIGSVFDGKYVYLVPNNAQSNVWGLIARFDAYPGFRSTAITAQQAAGGFSIGNFAGIGAPSGGLIISGNTGIGVSSPSATLDVTGGTIAATRVYTTARTFPNQIINLAEGNSSGVSGGVAGTQKAMSGNASANVDLSGFGVLGLQGGGFDGRYVYSCGDFDSTFSSNSGTLIRYDTTISFTSLNSYTAFNLAANINAACRGYQFGWSFDGRYIYNVSSIGGGAIPILATRYDTQSPFTSASSYSTFNLQGLGISANFYIGSVFDGRYVYFTAQNSNNPLVRYDTTLSFSLSTSYAFFNLNPSFTYISTGMIYDGRYITFAPSNSGNNTMVQYDTTLPLSTSTSYQVFSTATIGVTVSTAYGGPTFDGRYFYSAPKSAPQTKILRYDTTLSFSSTASYSTFDLLLAFNTNTYTFNGSLFDGRYVYFYPFNTAVIVRYDTTQPFGSSSSYTALNGNDINSNTNSFFSALTDGRYVYLYGSSSLVAPIGRLDAYPNSIRASAWTAAQAPSGFTIGSGVGSPSNGLLVAGQVGIGTSTPSVTLDVSSGSVAATRIYASGSTSRNQLSNLAQGTNQGGFGSSFIGTNKPINTLTAQFYSLINVNSTAGGFTTAFDGRYIYYIPYYQFGFGAPASVLLRYDTELPFNSTNSYSVFNTLLLDTQSGGYYGGLFDGRYIYLIPYVGSGQFYNGFFVRYDTTLPFGLTTSYSTIDLAVSVNSNSVSFNGGVYDGKYIYLIPSYTEANTSSQSGYLTRYDTTAPFSQSTSYTVFNSTSTQNPPYSVNFVGGAFDGRYVYYVPYYTGPSNSVGRIMRYDTTLSFSISASYSFFDATTVNSLCLGFNGAVFDGLYLYFVPYPSNITGAFAHILRYDTSLTFSNSASYASFDVSLVNSNKIFYIGGFFDGRYVYFNPYYNQSATTISGVVLRYDTTLSFQSASSYSQFDLTALNSNAQGFESGLYDGRYAYFVPQISSIVVRIDAYSGSQAAVYTANQSPNGLTIGASSAPPANGLLVAGNVGIGNSSPSYTLDVNGVINANRVYAAYSTFNNQLVKTFEGNSQGGFGSGVVGTQKTMSVQTSAFNSIINTYYGTFVNISMTFDGRYIYAITDSQAFIRYDTLKDFSSSASYISYNVSQSYVGSCFDGRYVYFAPQGFAQFGRYDTTQSFTSASSYEFFDQITNINSIAGLFEGLVFDGRYIYYTPVNFTSFIRYDTLLPFSNSSSYSVFDQTQVAPGTDFFGGSFDGRYIYYVPFAGSTLTFRYDTSLPFGSTSSYASLDMQTLSTLAVEFFGCVFDGRYVYYIPSDQNGTYAMVRYDINLPYLNTTSYVLMFLRQINSSYGSFYGATFDGRYIYLNSYANGGGTNVGNIARYDTTLPYTLVSSWSNFNAQTLNSSLNLFLGSIFDGRYVYFVRAAGYLLRMDAYPGPQIDQFAASQAPNGFTVGTLAGSAVAPNNMLVGGTIGVGTATPSVALATTGSINAQQRVLAGASSYDNQIIGLSQGNDQGGFGGGFVGVNKAMSTASTSIFDLSTANSSAQGFSGGAFDGRYVYFAPSRNQFTIPSLITRYDTFSPFSSTTSYSTLSLVSFLAAPVAYSGAIYDGRYVYFVPYSTASAVSSNFLRYDTYNSFSSTVSFTSFDLGISTGYSGAVFDGRYIYFVPYQGPLGVRNANITQYDTTQDFTNSNSYVTFAPATGFTTSGFTGGTFDGRYIYFVPNLGPTNTGALLRYDTTLPFATSTSYSTMDLFGVVSTASVGFFGASFDGRYVYLVPNSVGTTFNSQITRYDTTLSFSASASYSLFDTSTINSRSSGFAGSVFDGRYLYLIPNGFDSVNVTASGQMTRYDTTLPFNTTSSYSIFDTGVVNSLSAGFQGAVFDGRYLYLVPNSNGTASGLVTRIDSYPGPQVSSLNASAANVGLNLSGGPLNLVSVSTSGTATTGTVPGTLTNVAGYITLNINGSQQKIPYYNQ